MIRGNRKQSITLLTYVCVMFGLGTIFMVCSAALTQLAFIIHSDYSGGPNGVENDFFAAPVDEGGDVVWVIQCGLAADALLVRYLLFCSMTRPDLVDTLQVWRCTALHKRSRLSTWAVALGPGLILLGSISGVAVLLTLVLPDDDTPTVRSIRRHAVATDFGWFNLCACYPGSELDDPFPFFHHLAQYFSRYCHCPSHSDILLPAQQSIWQPPCLVVYWNCGDDCRVYRDILRLCHHPAHHFRHQ